MNLDDILARHDRAIDAVVGGFEEQLAGLVAKAQARTIAKVTEQIVFVNGRAEITPQNREAVRKIDQVFLDELEQLGYRELVDAFVAQFGGQFTYFDQVVAATLGADAAAKVAKFPKPAMDYLAMAASDGAARIEEMVARVASDMKQKALLSVAGLRPADLADLIAEQLGKTAGQAATAAATSISTFYRTITNVGYGIIEAGQPAALKFKYVGPPSSDPIERPFCKRLMRETEGGTSWTRDQIDRMDNGQLPNVFETCGGWNCRHQWIVDAKALAAQGARG